MKDSTGYVSQLAFFKGIALDDFNLLVVTALTLHPALKLKIKAGIQPLLDLNECDDVKDAFDKGEWEKVKDIY